MSLFFDHQKFVINLVALCAVNFMLAGTVHSADDTSYRIFIVQWRGDTKTDKGFKDYFYNRHVKVDYIIRNAEQNPDKIPTFIEEIQKVQPDLVYTWSMAVARGIDGRIGERSPSRNITKIPVVNCMVADPVLAGISDSWQSSGANFTGVSHVPPVDAQVRGMRIYKEVKKIAVIYNTLQTSPVSAVEKLRQLSETMAFELVEFPVPVVDGKNQLNALRDLVRSAARQKPDFLYIGPDSFLYINRAVFFEAINKEHLPSFAASEVFLRNGDALAGLVSNYYNVGQYCAYKAERILSEKIPPAEIQFDTLKRFSYIVNMNTAKFLSDFPPMNVLSIAEVIDVQKK